MIFTPSYLSAADFHAAVVQHLSVLAAAIYGANDDGIIGDTHFRTVDIAEAGIQQSRRLAGKRWVGVAGSVRLGVVAHAGSEDIAQVGAHGDIGGSYLSAGDGDERRACIVGTAVLFA